MPGYIRKPIIGKYYKTLALALVIDEDCISVPEWFDYKFVAWQIQIKQKMCSLFAIKSVSLPMKVHLIKKQTIEDYKKANPNSKAYFDDFLEKLKIADWTIPEDIQSTFSSADLLGKGSNRVVFDIGGNHYRKICWYVLRKEVHLFVKWIGTHPEYDELCGYGKRKRKRSHDADQYTINLY